MAEAWAVLCFGNRSRGDDGAGPAVARAVRARGLPAREHTGEVSALVEALSGLEAVVVVDALCTGGAAGTVLRFDASAEPLPVGLGRASSTHALGVAEGIELARAMGSLPARVVVYGIEGARWELGDDLSPEIEAAVSVVADRVRDEVAAWV